MPLLNCLGVADGWPSPDRGHSSYLYRLDTASVLIDAGDGASSAFARAHLDYNLVDALFLSHLHFDHIGGLFMLLQSFWLRQRTKPLTIYLPQEGLESIRQMIQTGYLFNELLPFTMDFVPLQPRSSISLSGLQITAFPTSHLDSTRQAFQHKHPRPFLACSFLLDSKDCRIGHSADIGLAADLNAFWQSPLDLLVCELAHVEPEELFSYLSQQPVKRIVFIHVSQHAWEHLKELDALARRWLPMPFSFARDGEELRF